MDREKIIEIAEFRGIVELTCKSCGAINSTLDIEYQDVTFKNNTKHVEAFCPDCGRHLQYMPLKKVWQIFFNAAVGMVEIEKVDNGRLQWQLNNQTNMNEDLRAAIESLIDRRTTDPAAFYVPPMDVDTKKDIDLLERQKYLIEEIAAKKAVNVAKVRDMDPGADAVATKKVEVFCIANTLIISNLSKELRMIQKKINKS